MKALTAAAIVLSLWSGLNLLVAAAVTAATLSGGPPPALQLALTADEIRAVDPRVLAVINAQASLANPCIVALCVLVLAISWTALRSRAAWALPALAGSLLPLQAFGFVSDGFLGGKNVAANAVSTAVLLLGLGLAVRRSPSTRTPHTPAPPRR